jgi:hypothetical protein
VSVFRPVARLTGADGRTWELYAYRFELPGRASSAGRARRLRTLARDARNLAAAALRSLRSDEWTVEAIAWLPRRTSYSWTTTREYRDHVLAQVEGQFARGEVPPRPRHATYLGAQG